ncbi:MAG: hypothetical protein AAFV33_07870 [Chloroflexota bacterium]
MPFVSEWDNEAQTVYRIEFTDKWDWDTFTSEVLAVYRMIGERDHNVDIIVGFMSPLPKGDALHNLTYAGSKQPPNLKRTVFINQAGALLTAIVHTIATSRGYDGPKFVESVEEARYYLEEPVTW